MNFKNLRLREFITALIVSLIWPVVKAIISENHLVAFCDSLTIIGLIAIIFGVFTSAVLHGDYDIAAYLARRRKYKNSEMDFDTYVRMQEEIRKDSFNYPLLIGIIFLVTAFLIVKIID